MNFYIKTEEITDLALRLQKINDVALPFAVQNTLNEIAGTVKINTLQKSAAKEFDVQRPTFFKANSGYKAYKAKDFNYNLNKIKSQVGMTAANKAHDKATEQIGSQETATPIKRSINPLGSKPQTKSVIDILSKKPEIYDSSSGSNPVTFLRTLQRAKSRGSGVIFAKGNRGALRQIKRFDRRKPTKGNPRKYTIETKPIASYIKSGYVKLNVKRPFLTNAIVTALMDVQTVFEEKAKYQIERAMKK